MNGSFFRPEFKPRYTYYVHAGGLTGVVYAPVIVYGMLNLSLRMVL